MTTTPAFAQREKNGWLLRLLVQPGAKRSQCAGLHGQHLKLRIHAPPVDGKANAELLDFLAKTLHLPKSQVQLLHGQTSRCKRVQIPLAVSVNQLLALQNGDLE